jgi:hypothetical protein
MQIHELTKLQKQLEEGLLDGVKAAIQTVKTSGGGLKGIGKALVSPRAYQQAKNDVLKKQGNKDLAAIQKKMNADKKEGDAGYWIAPGQKGYEQQQAAKKVASNPQATQQINDLTIQFQDTFGAMPEKGKLIKVELQSPGQPQPSIYYKNDKGIWSNEDGAKITKPDTIAALDKQIDLPGKAEEVSANSITIAERANSKRRQQRLAAGITQTDKKLPLSDFGKWAEKNVPGIDTALQNPTAKTEIQTLSNQIKTSQDVEKATPLFKKLMTTVVSATGDQGGQSIGGTASTAAGMPTKDFIDIIKQSGLNGLTNALRNDPPRQKTGSKTLDNALHDARLLETELHKELQAFKAGK